MRNPKGFHFVRITNLRSDERYVDGTEGIVRQPQIGDTATIVHDHDAQNHILECTNREGQTIWIADFRNDEFEIVESDPN